MERDDVYLRVSKSDYARLVKLIESDDKTRKRARERQMLQQGRTFCNSYVPKIVIEVLQLPIHIEEIPDVDEVDEEVFEMDTVDEQA